MRAKLLLSVRLVILSFAGFVSSLCAVAQSAIHRTENWIPDYSVYRLDHDNGYTLLSGSFYLVGPYTGRGVVTDITVGTVDSAMPKINGDVYSSAPDGSGGWYVGGYFSAVDTVKISNLVHIKADKTVDRSWKPNPDNSPSVIAVSGTTLYVGGYFTSIAGQTRNHIAAFDITTGGLTGWNPNANGGVESIEPAGTVVYVGGYFTTIGGASRSGLAAISTSTGLPTLWAPVLSGTFGATVYATAVDVASNTIFVGGYFTLAGGLSRIGAARFSLSTGSVTTWVANASTNGYVEDVVLSGGNLYIGGSFTSINGIARNNIAAVSAATSLVQAWNVGLDQFDFVDDMDISGNTLFFCGYFSAVNFIPRSNIAAVDLTTAALQNWAPMPNNSTNTVSATPGGVFLGGYFNGVNWVNRNDGFALFDDATDQAWPFNIDLNGGIVNAIAVKDKVLYIGGQFTAINKSARRNLAAIDLTTGQVLAWNPSVVGLSPTDPNVSVNSMKINGNLLYVGGKFLTVGISTRPGLAAIDLSTGVANGWNPSVGDGKTTNQFVNSIDIVGNTLYAAGSFSLLAGNQPRANLAAIDATNGSILAWNPVSNGVVDKIRISSNAAYVVGEFANGVGGAIRTHRVAALNLTNNNATSWDPAIQNGFVYDVALGASAVYAGGDFDGVGAQFRPGLASFDLSTGSLNAWNPDVGDNGDGGYSVNALASSQSKLYVGGAFNFLGTENRTSYGEYYVCPPTPSITDNGSVLSTSSTGNLQWYENNVAVNGATGQSYEINALEYGVYAVEVTAFGCTARSDDFVYLITETEVTKGNEISVYPNPVRDEIVVQIPGTSGTVDFTLMDTMGRTLKKTEGFGAQQTISVSDLDAGPYLLLIQTQEQKQVRKVIKMQ